MHDRTKLGKANCVATPDLPRGIFGPMLKTAITTGFLIALLVRRTRRRADRVYTWVDDDGQLHYGDKIPPEYADMPKQVLNEHGVRSIISRDARPRSS